MGFNSGFKGLIDKTFPAQRRHKNKNYRHEQWISCTAISITAETTQRVLVLATLRNLIRVKSEFKGLCNTGMSKHPRALRRFVCIGTLSPVRQRLDHYKTLLSVRWMLAGLLSPRIGVLLGLSHRSEPFVSMSTIVKPKQWNTKKYSFACLLVSVRYLVSHSGRQPTWRTFFFMIGLFKSSYMFRATLCSSSGGQLYEYNFWYNHSVLVAVYM